MTSKDDLNEKWNSRATLLNLPNLAGVKNTYFTGNIL